MEKRLQNIDLVKIIAMMMVLLLHNGVERGFSPFAFAEVPLVYSIGGIAIPLFFMVSGYLLSVRDADFQYSKRKIIGILRFCLLVCIPIDLMRSILAGRIVLSIPKCFLQRGLFAAFWYFGAMIIIYALLPSIIRIFRRKNGLCWFFAVSTLLSTSAFIADSLCQFEQHCICQSFRLWYWLMYFSLGAIIRKHEQSLVKSIPTWSVPVSCLLFVLLGTIVKIGGNEYLFGSIPCILYAFCTFVVILKTGISSSKCVDALSGIFLPVYAFHTIILQILYRTPIMSSLEVFPSYIAFILEYLVSVTFILSCCFILMSPSISKRLFHI